MTKQIFPAAHRRQYTGLARVFDENAARSDSALATYLQGQADQRVLTRLVEELFRVLDFTVVPVELWPDAFDTVVRKSGSEYPIHTVREQKPNRTTLQQLTAAHTNSTVPHSVLVTAVTPPSERVNRVAEHSGVRVIHLHELRALVTGAIARLTDSVRVPGTKSTTTSETLAKFKRLIAKLDAVCDKIDALVDQQEFAEATQRHETVHKAVSKAQSLHSTGPANQQLRERLSALETRVTDLTSTLQAVYADRIAAGDSHMATANTAVEDGDVTTGRRACENARAAYTDAEAIDSHAEIDMRGDTDETVHRRLETVTSLEQRLQVVEQVEQVEATIESLAAIVADTDATVRDAHSQSKQHAAVQAGHEQLDALPDDITTPELQARVTALEDQVEQFETAAERHQPPDDAGSTDEVTDARATEETEVIRTADDVVDRPRQPAPVALRVHEELLEDGRRTVFRAETLAGDTVQFDVWHRHSDADVLELNEWYLLENVRGQQWTVAHSTGVTLSTTPTVTVTSHDPANHSASSVN